MMEVIFGALFVLGLLGIGWKIKDYYEKEEEKAAKKRIDKKIKEITGIVDSMSRDELERGVRAPSSNSGSS